MPDTLCPACGHSPIPAGADECPVCHEPFAFLQTHKKAKNRFLDRRDGDTGARTTFGVGVTSELGAHPYQAATVALLGAVIWFLRASGVFGTPELPQWAFALVLGDLVLALLLVLRMSAARLPGQLLMIAQTAAALYLGREALLNPLHLMFAGHAVVGLILLSGEPGGIRRQAGLFGGVLLAAAAVVFMLVARAGGDGTPRQELFSQQGGYRLLLPSGYARAQPAELQVHLKVPQTTPVTASHVGFNSASARAVGMLLVNRNAEVPVIGGCQTLHHDLGGTNVPRPSAHRAPAALGDPAVVYEIRTFSGAEGLLACGRPDGERFVALTVLSVNRSAEEGAEAFDRVGAGLSLK